MYKSLIFIITWLVCFFSATTALADGFNTTQNIYMPLTTGSLSFALATESQQQNKQYLKLAAAEQESSGAMQTPASAAKNEEKTEFKTRWFTSSKFHQYLGLGSLSLALISAVLPKEEDGAHHDFAEGAAILGGAAVATGLVFHYDGLSLKKGFSNPDNWHALLTTLGTIGYFMALDIAPEANHAGFGVGGALLMLGGIKITW